MRKSLNSLTTFEPSPYQQIAFALPLAPAPALPESFIESCKLVAASRLLRLGLSTVSACFIQSLFISIWSWFSFFSELSIQFHFSLIILTICENEHPMGGGLSSGFSFSWKSPVIVWNDSNTSDADRSNVDIFILTRSSWTCHKRFFSTR